MFAELTPVQAFLAGALVVALISFVLILLQQRRHAETEIERQRLEAVAVKAREMLAAAPDGLFLWDHVNGGFTCSRRLAALLDLDAGIHTHYEDIRKRFEGDSLKALEQSVTRLRGAGTPFDLMLSMGRRHIQVIGSRAETNSGDPLADMVWMRGVTGGGGAEPRVASVNTSGPPVGVLRLAKRIFSLQHVAEVVERLGESGTEGQGGFQKRPGLGPVSGLKGGDPGQIEGVGVVRFRRQDPPAKAESFFGPAGPEGGRGLGQGIASTHVRCRAKGGRPGGRGKALLFRLPCRSRSFFAFFRFFHRRPWFADPISDRPFARPHRRI